MDIATWNVNSLKVRLDQVLAWLAAHPVDVLCLQELKMPDAAFPVEALAQAGYRAWWRGQKTYNGVAILTRQDGADPLDHLPGAPDDQSRYLALTVDGVRVVCVYVPNGGELDSDKYLYKQVWLAALTEHLRQACQEHARLVLCGDFNIAPAAMDVHDPPSWEKTPIFAPAMRGIFQQWLAPNPGLTDCFRALQPAGGHYSWWDYRMGSFHRNLGVRIDHILASPALVPRLTGCLIDRQPRSWPRPSDHVPVIASFV